MLVQMELYQKNRVQVNTSDFGYLAELKSFLTEKVEGREFMPKYKSGLWDGTISLFKVNNRTFPVGLIHEVLRFHKIFMKDIPLVTGATLKVSDDIKNLYKGDDCPIRNYDLLYNPNDRPYQLECINTAIKYRNCILLCGTGGGKSNILTYIFKRLYENNIISNVILVVPTINLVSQFKSDLIEYGIDETWIGQVGDGKKEWEHKIVISTWQTLVNNLDKLELFDSIFIDECHQVKSISLITILQECSHMLYKIGCTGTLPNNRLENLNIKSYLGPVVADFPVSFLIKEGYLSQCNVNLYNIHYKKKMEGSYNDVKDEVFVNPFRLNIMSDIVKSVKNENILLLVGKVKKEGEFLETYLKSCPEFKDHQIFFMSGKTKSDVREEWRQKCINEDKVILIAIFQLFQQGVNVPNLNHIVFASSYKSKIRTLQSIGRSLRRGNSNQAYIYDLVDYDNPFFPKHAKERILYYEKEEFIMNNIELKET